MLLHMTGSLHEHSPGVWRIRLDAGKDPVTGKRRQVHKTFHGGKRAAEKELARLVSQDTALAATKITLGALLEKWLEECRSAGHSPPQLDASTRKIKNLPDGLKAMPIDKIKTGDIDAWMRSAEVAGMGKASIVRSHAMIRSAFNLAIRWEWLSRNPASFARLPVVDSVPMNVPTVDQVRTIIEAAAISRKPEMAPVLTTLVLTGMRRGEACALQWGDIDWTVQTVTVRRSIWQTGKVWGAKFPKSRAGLRRIALDDVALETFRTRAVEAERLAAMAEVTLGPTAYVFSPEPDGVTPLMPNAVTTFTRSLCDGLGMPDVHPHCLRHVTATQLIGAGLLDWKVIAQRMGHSDAAFTARKYAGVLEANDRQAAAIMGALMEPISPPDGRLRTQR